MTDPDVRVRRRGVRASRIKLTKALTEAGLKTQAALAERIADLEGLSAAPKDIVNRVFREQPVDAATLERVARALGVEAYTLYLSGHDAPHDPEIPVDAAAEKTTGLAPDTHQPPEHTTVTPSPPSPPPRRWIALTAIAVAAVALGMAAWFFVRSATPEAVPTPGALEPRYGRFRVAVMEFKGDDEGSLGVAVRERLEKTLGVASAGLPLITDPTDRAEIAARFRTDLVIDGEVVRVGQWIGVRAYAYVESRGRREQIWGESFQASAQARYLPLVADRITAAVNRLLGLPSGEGRNPPHFPLAPVQDQYLNGRLHLDASPNELNLRRAQGSFAAALRHDPNYAEAHAGLCEVALDAVWIESEQRQLADAEKSCTRAMQLAPEHPEAMRAQAYFLLRSGRADESIALYRRLVAREPDDMEAVLGFAAAQFAMYQRSGDDTWREPALEAARRAAELTLDFWKPYMWLGVYEHGAGSLERAIAALARAAELDPGNEYVVANLGTMYFCRGDFTQARDLYLRAQEVAPANYAGQEMLGMLYYFLGDFPESARLRRAALDLARGNSDAEIHQMWGSLADSLRQSGDKERAVEAYRRAIEIIERDFLMGNATTGDKASRAYYYTALLSLTPQPIPQAIEASLDKDLRDALDSTTESYALLRLSQTALMRRNAALARAALDKAAQRCECYLSYPDLKPLLATRAGE
jgi:tetratricopeptide (TPR) repeat protein